MDDNLDDDKQDSEKKSEEEDIGQDDGQRRWQRRWLIITLKLGLVGQQRQQQQQLRLISPVMPAEILRMDERSLSMYKEALRTGKQKVYNIRVMVVGQYSMGKTTLTKRILGQDVNILDKKSTEGIDVHTNSCKISLSSGEWTKQEKDTDQLFRLQRLVKLCNEHVQKQEASDGQDGHNRNYGYYSAENETTPSMSNRSGAKDTMWQEYQERPSGSLKVGVYKILEEAFEQGGNHNLMELVKKLGSKIKRIE